LVAGFSLSLVGCCSVFSCSDLDSFSEAFADEDLSFFKVSLFTFFIAALDLEDEGEDEEV